MQTNPKYTKHWKRTIEKRDGIKTILLVETKGRAKSYEFVCLPFSRVF